jgi:tripartite-type tricarboxylate transporter receptor subunit TctC
MEASYRKEESAMKKRFGLVVALIFSIIWIANSHVGAADYPTKPITFIVPMSPGGGRDVQGRAFATFAQKLLGKPIVFANRPGANGMIGLLSLAKSTPDGHTVGVTSPTDIEAVDWEIANGRKPPITRDDFIYVGTFTWSSHMLAVPYNSPWKTLADLIKDAKAKPGFYSFASSGMNAGTHISVEIFMEATGLKFRHVPFQGGGPAVAAIVGNHVDFGLVNPASAMELVRGNKLRILSIQDAKRYKYLPDVPAVQEFGIVGAEAHGFNGLIVPRKTPMPVVEKLREVTRKVTEDKSFIAIIENLGSESNFITGEELNNLVKLESDQRTIIFRRLIKEQK